MTSSAGATKCNVNTAPAGAGATSSSSSSISSTSSSSASTNFFAAKVSAAAPTDSAAATGTTSTSSGAAAASDKAADAATTAAASEGSGGNDADDEDEEEVLVVEDETPPVAPPQGSDSSSASSSSSSGSGSSGRPGPPPKAAAAAVTSSSSSTSTLTGSSMPTPPSEGGSPAAFFNWAAGQWPPLPVNEGRKGAFTEARATYIQECQRAWDGVGFKEKHLCAALVLCSTFKIVKRGETDGAAAAQARLCTSEIIAAINAGFASKGLGMSVAANDSSLGFALEALLPIKRVEGGMRCAVHGSRGGTIPYQGVTRADGSCCHKLK